MQTQHQAEYAWWGLATVIMYSVSYGSRRTPSEHRGFVGSLETTPAERLYIIIVIQLIYLSP